MKAFAQENGFIGDLKHWDIPFWSQKQREHLFRLEKDLKCFVIVAVVDLPQVDLMSFRVE